MAGLLYDSIDARSIPRDAPAVAGYGDGIYCWSPSWVDGSNWWELFPAAVQLVIVVSAVHAGDVLDVETGDATPADCPGWADRFNRPARRRPTLYHSRELRETVLAAMAGRPYDWWAATLDGTQDVPGAVAVQYIDTGAFDESVILDGSWIGGAEVLDPNDPIVQDLQGKVDKLYTGWFTQQTELEKLASWQATAKTELDGLQSALAALQSAGVPPASLQPLQDAIGRLSAHLGVGTA